tara:strand:+ start:31583 stop:33103 length:1521 start_codon:yes stop_codon:yes gene_type:complete
MKFKYKATFNQEISASQIISDLKRDFHISKSSIQEIKDSVLDDANLEGNVDLIGVAFPFCVINQFNANDDAIGTEMAMSIKDSFISKPMNVEHDTNQVVGHIVGSQFSEHKDTEILSLVESRTDPFDMWLGSIVYKRSDNWYVEIIKDIEEGIAQEGLLSASWEIGFNDFHIGVGGSKLDDCVIITDPEEIEEKAKYLKCFGGKGETEEGVRVRRIIVGEGLGLGGGFTFNPAADVNGIYAGEYEEEEEEENISEKNSHSNIKDVDLNKMDKEVIIQIVNEIIASAKDKELEQEVVANAVSDKLMEKIQQESKRQEEAKEADLVEAAKKEAAAQKELEDLKESVDSLKIELDSVKTEKETIEAQATFDDRMAQIDEIYELGDEERVLIASQLKDLSQEEESFASYKKELAVTLKHIAKDYIKEQEVKFNKAVEAKAKELAESGKETADVSEGSETEEKTVDTEKVLEDAKASAGEESIPNTVECDKNQTTFEKLSSQLSESSITII